MRIAIVLATLALAAPTAQAAPAIRESLSVTPAQMAHPNGLRERRGLKPGMLVVDRAGQRIGVIHSVDNSAPARAAVVVVANGARYRLRDADLRLSRHGERAIVMLSRADLRTRAILNTNP